LEEPSEQRPAGGAAAQPVKNDAGKTARRVTTSRAEAFSDGVLAIAITLLVLDLNADFNRGELAHDLGKSWPTYLAYLSSFLYVGVIWLNHHAAFSRIRYVDRGLNWANLGLLLGASVLPFPTAVIGRAVQVGTESDGRAAVLLYAGVATFVGLSWLYFYHYLHTHPALSEPDVPPGFFGDQRRRATIGVVAYIAAAIIAVITKPYVALALFFILPVFYAVTSEGTRSEPNNAE
jgi:uncharacterized membrane protein